MFKKEFHDNRSCDPRREFSPPYRHGYETALSEPDDWHKPDKYDADSIWDGETLDEDKKI